MYIIIVGGGKIGRFLGKKLSTNKHAVAIIDKNKAICDEIAKDSSFLVITGDGCELKTLEDAGISRANVVAAVTGDDEDNLVICQLAKERFAVGRTVARVNDPKNERTFAELGIDIPIDATRILAKIIEEEVSFADFVNLMSFNRGKLAIVRVDLPKDSPVINKMVQEITLPNDSVLVSIIRAGEVVIPKGKTVLKAGDDIIALTIVENKQQLLQLFVGNLQ